MALVAAAAEAYLASPLEQQGHKDVQLSIKGRSQSLGESLQKAQAGRMTTAIALAKEPDRAQMVGHQPDSLVHSQRVLPGQA